MTVNPVFHPMSKHIAIDYHFVREKVDLSNLVTRFVWSPQHTIDIFTKPLPKVLFQNLTNKLEVYSIIPSNLKKGEEADNQSGNI